jgi:hypothetical protein
MGVVFLADPAARAIEAAVTQLRQQKAWRELSLGTGSLARQWRQKAPQSKRHRSNLFFKIRMKSHTEAVPVLA